MPLSELQARVLALLAANRTEESHLAGATAIHMATASPRRSADLDLFHDREQAVADAFALDRATLERNGLTLDVQLSQPGFIRALVGERGGRSLRIDWAHDSMWRFLPPVRLTDAGYVLHPVDLAVNKVLALAGRDEPRDFVDILYLQRRVLPLGALCWAACAKDPGLNPEMLLELLARKGRFRQQEFDRLDLEAPFNAAEETTHFRDALQQARAWIPGRPPHEAGCLYRRPASGVFFAPSPGEAYDVHHGAPGGVLPVLTDQKSLYDHPAAREQLESFFERRMAS